jgi:hypothetical protein
MNANAAFGSKLIWLGNFGYQNYRFLLEKQNYPVV